MLCRLSMGSGGAKLNFMSYVLYFIGNPIIICLHEYILLFFIIYFFSFSRLLVNTHWCRQCHFKQHRQLIFFFFLVNWFSFVVSCGYSDHAAFFIFLFCHSIPCCLIYMSLGQKSGCFKKPKTGIPCCTFALSRAALCHVTRMSSSSAQVVKPSFDRSGTVNSPTTPPLLKRVKKCVILYIKNIYFQDTFISFSSAVLMETGSRNLNFNCVVY